MTSRTTIPTAALPVAPLNVHARSLIRHSNLKKLVFSLRDNPMQRDEIAGIFKFSPSGARNYIKDLRLAGLITIIGYPDERGPHRGLPLWGIVLDAAHVEKWLSRLDAGECAGVHKQRPKNLMIAMKDKTRHFHILSDDAHFNVKVSRSKGKPDPIAQHLFGRAPAADSRADGLDNFPEPARPAKISPWEALMQIRFDLGEPERIRA
jgi:hypothetical protein